METDSNPMCFRGPCDCADLSWRSGRTRNRAADRGQQFAISRPGVSEHAGEGRLPEPVVDRVQLVLHVAGLVPSTTPEQRLR